MRYNTMKQLISFIDKVENDSPAFEINRKNKREMISFGQLSKDIKILASVLKTAGFKKGCKAGLISENRVEWVVTYLAVTSLGGIIVPLDPGWSEKELIPIINNSDIEYLFYSGFVSQKLSTVKPVISKVRYYISFDEPGDKSLTTIEDLSLLKRNKFKKIFFRDIFDISYNLLLKEGEELLGKVDLSSPLVDPDDVSTMIYTESKFAMLTHKGILENSYYFIERISDSGNYLKSGDKSLSVLPLHHTYPFVVGCLVPILTGGIICFTDKPDIKSLISLIDKSKINYFSSVPLQIEGIARLLSKRDYSTDSLKYLITGGASIKKTILEEIENLGITIFAGYGLTEHSPIVSVNSDLYNKISSVGKAFPQIETKLINKDREGNGELLLRSSCVMKGFYKNRKETSEVIDKEGWLHTGDIVRIDDEGFIFITGRCKDVIIGKNAKNVYPKEIEKELIKADLISEVSIAPFMDEKMGEQKCAKIIPSFRNIEKQKITPDEIEKVINTKITEVMKSLSSYKKIERIEIVNEKPEKEKTFMFGDFYHESFEKPKVEVKKSEKLKEIEERIADLLINETAEILGVLVSEIDPDESFLNYLDSVSIINLSEKIEKKLSISFNPAEFFESPTVKGISSDLLENNTEAVFRYFDEKIEYFDEEKSEKQERKKRRNETVKRIAVIGMSCKFPDSANQYEFWKNLENSRNLISEIPENRFNWKEYYGDSVYGDRIDSKWGGFVKDIDSFDAQFFNISPREAELMDPQQRIFLETVWGAIEDAGYSTESISGKKVGIFAGVSTADYDHLLSGINSSAHRATGIANSILSNRISYFLNLHGPSETIDTACSSSLVAIHRAVNSIQSGESDIAVAGGVNALLSPDLFVSFSKMGMLSPDGKCRTFDKDANGYVRGEGVGAVILKSFDKAVEDNDNIYAEIIASSVNHGGKASSLTAPNSKAQTELLMDAYTKGNIDVETISYIEAHGTGTSLGDPVEVNGLKSAFKKLRKKDELSNWCGIGSVKTNIGHLEAAAGMAGIIKTILAMKNREIPATINLKKQNPYINLKDSPFFIVDKKIKWERLKEDGGTEIPRRAGVSSFGFGGTNAHIVLEESRIKKEKNEKEERLCLVPVSARSKDRLFEYIESIIAFLEENKDISIEDLAWTMQVGRSSMEERAAFIAESSVTLLKNLKRFISEKKGNENTYTGNIFEHRDMQKDIMDGNDWNTYINSVIKSRNLKKIAKLWIAGSAVSWEKLSSGGKRRISLPSYPFSKTRYWYEERKKQDKGVRLHPLVEQNVSTMSGQLFSTKMRSSDKFLKDHKILGKCVLPGAVHLEMAMFACSASAEAQVTSLKDIVWEKPVIIGDSPEDVFIRVYNESNGLGYSLGIGSDDSWVEYSKGIAWFGEKEEKKIIDISSIKEACFNKVSRDESYGLFEKKGLVYGQCLRFIQWIKSNDKEVLAKITVPENEDTKDYTLIPGIIDSALQSVIALFKEGNTAFLPYRLKTLKIHGRLTENCYAVVRKLNKNENGIEVDISITDDAGAVIIELLKLSAKEVFTRSTEEEKKPAKKTDLSQDNKGAVEKYLKNLLSTESKISLHKIDSNTPLERYGIDSMIITSLNRQLENDFGKLSKTLFFEYRTIGELAEYFNDYHSDIVSEKIVVTKSEEINLPRNTTIEKKKITRSFERKSSWNIEENIAVIGIAGKYPESENKDAFWENLKLAADCIETVPESRWDYRNYYSDQNREGKSNSKWGGFLKDFDKFDPLFFKISPSEAEMIDPQERLFLETTWEAFEDSGYTRSKLNEKSVGVYVGVMYGQYELYGVEEYFKGNSAIPGSSYASVANRISYYFDFNGPSMAVDTMCSSSLTAIHLACESIKRGECNMAVAGGVNLSIHPNKYLFLGNGKFTSSDGKCRSFGEGGDGYVPGEGVGAVILKPVKDAEKDGDYIYGVIKASSLNHGGKTNGYTVPNPNAQADLILNTLNKAKVEPETISYIEAHGTGTSLGDPIEITGLSKAFGKDVLKQSCPIGSVKSNMGHMEAAAGVAGLTKVLIQMKYKKLVPSIHSEELNSNINFSDTPFFVQKKYEDWGNSRNCPLRAGVSAFGAGGANAHLIIEEYPKNNEICGSIDENVFILSARNSERLKEYAKKYLGFINSNKVDLLSFLYTIQTGREEMAERLAFPVEKYEDLKRGLTAYIEGNGSKNVFKGSIKKKNISEILDIKNKSKREIAQRWVKGDRIDWDQLYDKKPVKTPLPSYPFIKKRYWINTSENEISNAVRISPLIDENVSDFSFQRFRKRFSVNDSYLDDHVISGKKILPGAVFLEMAIEGSKASGKDVNYVSEITWNKPFAPEEESEDLYIILSQEKDEVLFQINKDGEEEDIFCFGRLKSALKKEKSWNIEEIKKRTLNVSEGSEIYEKYFNIGFEYGESLRTIEKIYFNEEEVLSYIKLPKDADSEKYSANPSLLDGAFQSVLSFLEQENKTYVPFSVKGMYMDNPLKSECIVYVREEQKEAGVRNFEINILDHDGNVLLHIDQFSLRELFSFKEPKAVNKTSVSQEKEEAYYYTEKWVEKESKQEPIEEFNLILFDNDKGLKDSIEKRYEGINIFHVSESESFCEKEKNSFEINPESIGDYKKLLNKISSERDKDKPVKVIHAWSGKEFISNADTDSYLNKSVYSLLYFSKAYMDLKLKEKFKLLYLYRSTSEKLRPYYAAVDGFIKTIRLENPVFDYKLVEIESGKAIDYSELTTGILGELFINDNCVRINPDSKERFVRKITEVEKKQKASEIREEGTYLITGGFGGLGLIFARYLSKEYKVNLILTGRSDLSDNKKEILKEMESKGSTVIYLKSDISDFNQVSNLVDDVKERFGNISGVIHCAGILRDGYLFTKEKETFEEVITPKIKGAVNLDEALKNESLDFFILFSSVVSLTGNPGQCDYAYANSFLDNFASMRNKLNNTGKRYGKTISINWPLWKDGGMGVNPENEKLIYNMTGMTVLEKDTGIKAFIKSFKISEDNFMVASGKRNKIEKWLKIEKEEEVHEEKPENIEISSDFREKITRYVSEILKIEVKDIDSDTDISDYGFDSVSYTSLSNRISENFDIDITPALFFEYPTINTFSGFLSRKYSKRDKKPGAEKKVILKSSKISEAVKIPDLRNLKRKTFNRTSKRIAVIGISGKFPGSENLSRFWENLIQGKNLIKEIPVERFDWKKYYGDPSEGEKTNSKWGGFIDNIDKFDPEFFNISPKEAEYMDPQQRIFLEVVWNAVENSGYSTKSLSGRRVGLFAGAATSDYNHMTRGKTSPHSATGLAHSILTNRISYLLNIHGPSETIDTACSSSLVAIHRAVKSIQNGESEIAIAGGVNALLSPDLFITFSKTGMLSPDGQCRAFDKEANGYTRGEGAGAVVLKDFDKALEDGDHIYSEILVSSVNHGGKANSLTAPNPNAQADLIFSAYNDAGVDAKSISYIEAHGTGTSLGDPIEVNGLKNAFSKLTGGDDKGNWCGIGSVKSNIGHLETASGIAGFLKVILALGKKKIPPTINFNELNPYISLDESPFYIVDKIKSWESSCPRRAGISSFGFGGTNAHVVLEEYNGKRIQNDDGNLRIIPVSARNKERLKIYIENLIQYLEENDNTDFCDFAWTMQVGRDAFEERIAVIVDTKEDLLSALIRYKDSAKETRDVYSGSLTQLKDMRNELMEGEDWDQYVDSIIQKNDIRKIARLWVIGTDINWEKLHKGTKPSRIPLPGYPFARERFWLDNDQDYKAEKLHPFIDRNVSTLDYQMFSSYFKSSDKYLRDHQIMGMAIIPGVVTLEMAFSALSLSGNVKVTNFKDIVWEKPLIIRNKEEVLVRISEDGSNLNYSIGIGKDDDYIEYSHGIAGFQDNFVKKRLNVEEIKASLNSHLSSAGCYREFEQNGFKYGKSLKTINWIKSSESECLAELRLSETETENFTLSPGLLDGAIQSVIGILINSSKGVYLPFSLKSLIIISRPEKPAYSYVKVVSEAGDELTVNIKLIDRTGNILIELKDLVLKESIFRKVDEKDIKKDKKAREVYSDNSDDIEKFGNYLKNLISVEAKIKTEKIRSFDPLEKYGIDSMIITSLNKKLENDFGQLSKTLFFEYGTIRELSEYFVHAHEEKVREIVSLSKDMDFTPEETAHRKIKKIKPDNKIQRGSGRLKKEDIAIIGVAGKYPGSENVEEFWNNLKEGADCITEIPQERWNFNEYFDEEKGKKGKSYSKWGGFIKDVDKFDPLFFKISPKEASLMDPQERLFLEVTWKAIEDSGLTRQGLSDKQVGVYLGVMYGHYELFGIEEYIKGNPAIAGSSFASIANRVSYHFNFNGPSIALDTMCSSSLTAIHLACESIKRGECEIAVAGGVNLSIHPNKYLFLSRGMFTSSDGKCRSFGEGGDGYVPGEGVGAVILKSLKKAKEDNDNIYGIIKGSSLNHGGKTNGFTVPNPNAQSDLIKNAFQNSWVDPLSISYLEAHGTGTSLGDPIEITGLVKSFDTDKKQYCPVGSVKSNMGHMEAAAGIAGLTKVLMQIKHEKLVPSINSEILNPNINFKDTPFYVQKDFSDWKQPEEYPRRAGISAFGAGGANAHLIVEEYKEKTEVKEISEKLFVLSARNRERLEQYVRKFITFLSKVNDSSVEKDITGIFSGVVEVEPNEIDSSISIKEYGIDILSMDRFVKGLNEHFSIYLDTDTIINLETIKNISGFIEKGRAANENINLTNLVYTLQTGREEMKERVAVIASDVKDLLTSLKDFLSEKEKSNIFTGRAEDGSLNEIESNNPYEIAKSWVEGGSVNWNKLYEEIPFKISLPTYPFEKMSCWINQKGSDLNRLSQIVNNKIPNTDLLPKTDNIKDAVFIKEWKESDSELKSEAVEGSCIVIGALKNNLEKYFPQNSVFIEEGDTYKKESPNSYFMDLYSEEDGNKIIEEIRDGSYRGFIDFSDLNSSEYEIAGGKIRILQELIKKSVSSLKIIHFTGGLHSFKNSEVSLSGACSAGIIKMLGVEYSKVKSKTIDLDRNSKPEEIIKILKAELTTEEDYELCYRDGVRYTNSVKEISVDGGENHREKSGKDSVIIVTGGTRGIGFETALHFYNKGYGKFVLMGVQSIPPKEEWQRIIDDNKDPYIKEKLITLKRLDDKAEVKYYIGSLTDKEKLDNFFDEVRKNFGEISGVIHCAGLVSDVNPSFVNKEISDIQKVMEPKVKGLVTLSSVFEKDTLDFFVLFSSISSFTSQLSTGLSDYAAANHFMDIFSGYQFLKGKTYYKSINWPSWKETGMGEIKSPLYKNLGLLSHKTTEGLSLFDKIMGCKIPSLMPSVIDADVFKEEKLLINSRKEKAPETKTLSPVNNENDLLNFTRAWLKKKLFDELNIPVDQIDEEASFGDFGIDSIYLAELVRSVEKDLDVKIDPSIFLEFPTLISLSIHLCELFPENIRNMKDESPLPYKSSSVKAVKSMKEEEIKPEHTNNPDLSNRKIAIIGIGCHFPGAENKEEFWENLLSGKSGIKEIPKLRWDKDLLYHKQSSKGKSISKWGGFIDDIEYFDPDYFNISEEDARETDPLIRQMLEVSVQTLNDSGYEKKELWNKKVGVFIGSRIGNYMGKISKPSKKTIAGIGQNFIASHISHFFNFKGPNLVVDTACSSSVVSVNIACQSLLSGESDIALAGGVDILLDEKPYLLLSEAMALSPDGRCKTFDEKADGFVPGEGCGAILLKPLDKAVESGDKIYAVIESVSTNNDGRTMGITTPDLEGQMEVIESSIRNAGIDPSTIGYVEAHGTGTMIGDPIEMKGLTKVFRKFTDKKEFCAVGSVKSNIGHLLSAAGIASIIKVALSINNGVIPPTINCEKPNPRFEFSSSPFFPVVKATEWKPLNGERRAGISSFGFGGTNAHAVLSSLNIAEYKCVRKSLEPAVFNKRRFWLDGETTYIIESDNIVEDFDDSFLPEILKLKKVDRKKKRRSTNA